jgi:hypothetical protein
VDVWKRRGKKRTMGGRRGVGEENVKAGMRKMLGHILD